MEFHAISYIWKATTAKRMEIDPYCQRQNCSPLNVLFINAKISLILLGGGVPPLGGYSYITPRRTGLSATAGFLVDLTYVSLDLDQILAQQKANSKVKMTKCHTCSFFIFVYFAVGFESQTMQWTDASGSKQLASTCCPPACHTFACLIS